MAKRVGVLEADQPLNAEPRTFIKKSVAELLVRRLEAVRVARNLIKMVKIAAVVIRDMIKGYWDGPMGYGNVIPFSAPTDPTKKFHYEIPRAGEKGLFRRHFRGKLYPSVRQGMRHLQAATVGA